MDTHPYHDKYLNDLPTPNTIIRKRAAVTAAVGEGWTGEESATKAQLAAAYAAFNRPGVAGIGRYGSNMTSVRETIRATVAALLADPDESPFIDQVAVERAVNFDQAALRSLTVLEWDAFGGVLHDMGDYAFGDRFDGDIPSMIGVLNQFPPYPTVAQARDERRKAFLSLPADLDEKVRRAALRAKNRIATRVRRPSARVAVAA